MPLENYYFNITSRRFVRSYDDPGEVDAPVFGNNDTRDFGVTFLSTIAGTGVQVLVAASAARVDLADPAAPTTSIVGVSGTANSDNQYEFILPITGFGSFASGFMSAVTQPKAARIEFTITSSSGRNRYPSTIFIAPNTSSEVPSETGTEDRALGADEAAGVYIPKEVPQGMRMIWKDEATGQTYSVGFANGQFLAELQ